MSQLSEKTLSASFNFGADDLFEGISLKASSNAPAISHTPTAIHEPEAAAISASAAVISTASPAFDAPHDPVASSSQRCGRSSRNKANEASPLPQETARAHATRSNPITTSDPNGGPPAKGIFSTAKGRMSRLWKASLGGVRLGRKVKTTAVHPALNLLQPAPTLKRAESDSRSATNARQSTTQRPILSCPGRIPQVQEAIKAAQGAKKGKSATASKLISKAKQFLGKKL